MVDMYQGCTETSDDCGLHNLMCGYPNCHKGKRDQVKNYVNKPKMVTLQELPDHMEYVARPKSGYLYNGEKCCNGYCDGACTR